MTAPASRSIGGLALWLAVTFIAAAIGSLASAGSGTFYGALAKPSWAPPASVFGPVWTMLYLMMAVAAWLVWRERHRVASTARAALALYLAQLLLNALWTWLFFAWNRGAISFADIVVLWALISATMVLFWRVRPVAGMLLAPYLLWVTYAAALNFSAWRMNPGVLGG
jgi:benzodiazapine receptor